MFVNQANYYEVLNVSLEASEQEIKDSYKILAHKYHPDKGGTAKEFEALNRAYSTLKDTKKRRYYNGLLVEYYICFKQPDYILNNRKYIIINPEKSGTGLPESPLIEGRYIQVDYGDYRVVFAR